MTTYLLDTNACSALISGNEANAHRRFQQRDSPPPAGLHQEQVASPGHRARIVGGRADMPDTASVVHSDPEILGGTPVFVGARVPFRNLIDYLERNHSLDEFLDSFPTVSREQAVAALEAAHEALSARARSAR
jgi:uncharacterized protein (DUF433 family)